jgi:hypothetical protein
MPGQINGGTFLGNMINVLSRMDQFINYVEVGTWNGQGSTKCFMDGLNVRQDDDSCLFSIEADKMFYEQAKQYWSSLKLNQPQKLKLLCGRIIELHELISVDETHSLEPEWKIADVENYEECENIIDKLPDVIDVLLLDGGEFSTYAEFEKLKGRTNVILLDDTVCTKNKKVRANIIEDGDVWKIVYDNPQDRNGVMVVCRHSYYELVASGKMLC